MDSVEELLRNWRELNQLNEELVRISNANIDKWTLQERYENLRRIHNLRADIFAYERLLLIEYESEIRAQRVNVP